VAGVAGTAGVAIVPAVGGVLPSSANLTNLAPNTLYTVTVNQVGASGFATASTKTFTTPPGSVSNVSLSATATTGTLSWTNPVGGGLVSIAATTTAATAPALGAVAANGTTSALTKLVAGASYTFTITVKNAAGTVLGMPVTYTALAVPAPTGLLAANIASANSVVLKFTPATGVTAYTVQMATSPTGPWTNMSTATTTALGVTTATATATSNFISATYYFRVMGSITTGTAPNVVTYLGTPSGSTSVNMSLAPTAPSLPSISFPAGIKGTAILSWTKAASVTSVDVLRSEYLTTSVGGSVVSGFGSPVTIATVTNGLTTYTDSALVSAHVYQYRLVARNPAGTTTGAVFPAAGFTAP